jgi:hypothetical protein
MEFRQVDLGDRHEQAAEHLRSLPTPDASQAVMVREVTMEHLQDASGDPIAFLLDGKYRHEGTGDRLPGTTETEHRQPARRDHPIHTHLSDFRS